MHAPASRDLAPWQEVARLAQSIRDASIQPLHPPLPSLPPLEPNVAHWPRRYLEPAELTIVTLAPEELLRSLVSGALTAKAVANAYLRSAALAQKLVNCLTELLPERALHRAQELDDYYARHGKPIGPLHGLPISLKEHIDLDGRRVTGAFCSNFDRIAKSDAYIVKILSDAGAVVYCRTTMPQTTMHLETASNLYGVTVNPFNRALTAGGSSGGEGSLLALHGSCLGIGSDIGGSIRSPAANNGLYGLRPTTYRLPLKDVSLDMDGMEQILCVIGPLSTSLAGIDLFMRTVLAASPWLVEPSIVPIPWRTHDQLPARLKVGLMPHDGVVTPHPPVQRALATLAAKLRAAPDVQVVPFAPHRHDYAWELIASLFFPDGGESEKAACYASAEPWLPLSRWILTENPHVRHLSIEETWRLTAARERYRAEYAAAWAAAGVDVLLCPAGPGAAPPLGCARYWAYTSQWNLLDYPALVFPVTRVDQALDARDAAYAPMNAQDRWNWELYTGPERYRDAPVGLQLVGRRYEDEKVVQAVRRIAKYV